MANYQNQINAAAELSSKEYNASQKANELAVLGTKAAQTNPYKAALYTATANSLRDARGYALQIAAISENGYDPQLSAALKAASKTFVPAACHKRAGAYEIQADNFDKFAAKTLTEQASKAPPASQGPIGNTPPVFQPPGSSGNPYPTPSGGGGAQPPLNGPPNNPDLPDDLPGGAVPDDDVPPPTEPSWLVPGILLAGVALAAWALSKAK